jgi:hypothetical protein
MIFLFKPSFLYNKYKEKVAVMIKVVVEREEKGIDFSFIARPTSSLRLSSRLLFRRPC